MRLEKRPADQRAEHCQADEQGEPFGGELAREAGFAVGCRRLRPLRSAGSTAGEALARRRGKSRPEDLRVRQRGRSGVGAAHVVSRAAARSMDASRSRREGVRPARQAAAGRPRGGPVPIHGRSSAVPRRSEGGRAVAVCRIRAGDAGWIYSPGGLFTGRKTPFASADVRSRPLARRSPGIAPRRAERRPAARRGLRHRVRCDRAATATARRRSGRFSSSPAPDRARR